MEVIYVCKGACIFMDQEIYAGYSIREDRKLLIDIMVA